MKRIVKLFVILITFFLIISFTYAVPGATCRLSGYIGWHGGCGDKEYCNNAKICVSVPEIQTAPCPSGFVAAGVGNYCVQSYCNKPTLFKSTYYQYSAAGKCAWNEGAIFNEYQITCDPTSENPTSLTIFFYQLNTSRTGTRGNSYFAQVPNSKKYCNQNLRVNIVGSGQVNFSESTTPCTQTCTKSFLGSKTITLTATPTNGFDFNGWSGACNGIGNCIVHMENVPTVTATFVKEICDGIDNTGDGLIDVKLNSTTNLIESVCDCFDYETKRAFSISNTLGTNHPNLVGYWPLDTLNSNITPDINGTPRTLYNAQIVNSTKTTGLFQDALSFNGTTSTAHITSNDMLRNVSGATLSAWIKPTSITLNGYRGIISVSVGETDYKDSWSRASISLNGGKVRVVAREADGTSASATFETTNNVITPNTWSHVVGLINYSTNNVKVYVNGVEKPLTQISNSWSSTTTTPNTNSFEASIGSEDWGSAVLPPNGENAFSGLIDDATIFNTTLTECEIKKLSMGPSACFEPCNYCIGPDNSIIGYGEQKIYYEIPEVPFGEECTQEQRFCSESGLSGSYTYSNCTIKEPIRYNCEGLIDTNAIIIEGDDLEIFEPTINTLVDSNTSNKCEWVCSNNTIRNEETCVCPIGKVWSNNTCLYPNEVEKPIGEINSIINLNYKIDQNLKILPQCLYNDFDSNIEIKKNNEIIFSKTKITCGIEPTTQNFDSRELEENDLLEITTTINQPCNVCSKTIYINYKTNQTQSNNIIPDNNIFLTIILILTITTIIKIKKIKL